MQLGNQEVKFLFWGKILQDSGTNGSYIVREIRGKRWNPPTHPEPTKTKEQDLEEPEWEFINMAPHFKTKEYNTKDFTEAEWNSEEKKARIQFLESQIKK